MKGGGKYCAGIQGERERWKDKYVMKGGRHGGEKNIGMRRFEREGVKVRGRM